jgi:hypothetical protein
VAKERKEKEEHGPVGGVTFFVSLLVLYLLGICNLIIVVSFISTESLFRWRYFIIGGIGGAAFAHYFIRGHIAVFLHELKHAVLANLAGNRAKGMKIDEASGHFEYSYTKETAHMNALISLAPYFLPVLFVPCLGISYALAWNYPPVVLVCAGIGYGADLVLNIKEISPWQSDLTGIRGGFPIALAYIIAMNLALFSFIAAWASAGFEGLQLLFFGLLKIGGTFLNFVKGA